MRGRHHDGGVECYCQTHFSEAAYVSLGGLVPRWASIRSYDSLPKQCSNLEPNRSGSNVIGTSVANFCFNPCQALFIGEILNEQVERYSFGNISSEAKIYRGEVSSANPLLL